MLSDTLSRVPRDEGLQLLLRRGERGAQELTIWRLCLGPGQSDTFRVKDEETVFVLQQGRAVLTVGDARLDVVACRASSPSARRRSICRPAPP